METSFKYCIFWSHNTAISHTILMKSQFENDRHRQVNPKQLV